MPMHFPTEEFAARKARAVAALKSEGLDALLIFAPESQYWISGYDTFGFAMFQCMVLSARGDLHLLTRMPDLRQAQQTSTLTDDDIHIWAQYEGCNPARDLAALLRDLGIADAIGIEGDTAGLTDFNGRLVRAELPPLREASDLIRRLRRDKTPGEIAMHRRAAALADDALEAGLAGIAPGAFEGDILAAMQGAVFRGGGDYPGNEFIIGSGERALMCRYFSGRRHLDAQDQLTLEWAGTYARYHAAMMRTVLTGTPCDGHKRMHATCAEALVACEAAIRPGAPMGDVHAAHAAVFDRAGYGHARLQACGYGMGATFTPMWIDLPMFHENNPTAMAAGQVFFLHMVLMDSDAGLAMTLGHSVLITETGVERLSRHGLDLLVR